MYGYGTVKLMLAEDCWNFTTLLDLANRWLLTSEPARDVWVQFYNNRVQLTQEVFTQIIHCARQQNPGMRVRAYVNQLLQAAAVV